MSFPAKNTVKPALEAAVKAALDAAPVAPAVPVSAPTLHAPPPDHPPPAPDVVKADPIRPLTVPRMRPIASSMGDSGNLFRATAPRGTPAEWPRHDEFWSSNADKLLVGDIIQVIPDDAEYFQEFYVYDADSPGKGVPNKRVSVAEIRFVDMHKVRRVPQADEYKVELRGDFLKWCVIHITSDKPIFEKCYDKGEAQEKLRAFLRTKSADRKKAE